MFDGKTTLIKRLAVSASEKGKVAFFHSSNFRPDIDSIIDIIYSLSQNKNNIIIFIDNAANHIVWLASVIEKIKEKQIKNVEFVLSDNNFRKEMISEVMHSLNNFNNYQYEYIKYISIQDLSILADIYRKEGILAYDLRGEKGIKNLSSNPIGLICISLVNEVARLEEISYKAINNIIVSNKNSKDIIFTYLIVALSKHCYSSGIRYSALHKCLLDAGITCLKDYVNNINFPLVIKSYPDRGVLYVLPESGILASSILRFYSKNNLDVLLQVFVSLGKVLSKYVSRSTIRQQTPEARLAARLFDFDKVVLSLLGNKSIDFYDKMKEYWDWNSRFWEQISLMHLSMYKKTSDAEQLKIAMLNAENAVNIERHPFPLTTAATIFLEMYSLYENNEYFTKSYNYIIEALNIRRSRKHYSAYGVHPYNVLFRLVLIRLKKGRIDDELKNDIIAHIKNFKLSYQEHSSMKLVEEIEKIIYSR